MLFYKPMRPLTILALPFLLAGCVLPASVPAATEPPPATEPSIAVDHEVLGVDYLLPGASVVHDGTAHLWVVAFDADDAPAILHFAGTEVGAWEADATPVVINDDDLGLDVNGPIPSSVLVEADGTWTMYGGGRRPGDDPVIWRATAPAPNGPWTLHPAPVLEPSTVGWDDEIVDHPSVVATEDGYLMTYGGASGAAPNRSRIGAAVSADGIAWERVPIAAPDADDEHGLGPSACGIEARTMFEPELVDTSAGYRLHFGAMLTEPRDTMVIGELASDDGISWRCAIDGPLLEPDVVVEGASVHSYLAVRGGGHDELLVEVLRPDTPSSDIWLVAP